MIKKFKKKIFSVGKTKNKKIFHFKLHNITILKAFVLFKIIFNQFLIS